MTSDSTLPPANWYPDPHDPAQLRYWDGIQWTEHRAPAVPPPPPLGAGSEVEVVEATTIERAATARGNAISVTKSFAAGFLGKRQQRAAPSIDGMLSQLRLEEPRHPLEEQVEVAGETYAIKGIKRAFQELSVPITSRGNTIEQVQCILVPEPWNPYDPNAVAVTVGRHHVGYLPADLAASYASPLAQLVRKGLLATGEARIWAKDDGGMIRARVTILIPEAAAFH